ncbi:MAG TPA: antibiotic biosynthesis monooxygenase family protein [Terracidiphilus sp.]
MKPVTQINVLSIKPDKIDEFFEADRSYIASSTLPKGVLGSRLYKSLDGRSAVRVTQYESAEAHKAYHQNEGLQQQIGLLRAFVESASPALYEEVHSIGDFR